tara:strand:+ start:343 stop:819 length:477 start_codon:yes stop_codon:yes gene_type:complete
MKLTEQKLRIIIQEEIKSLSEDIDISDDMSDGEYEEMWNKLAKRNWDFKSKYFGKIKFDLSYANVDITEARGGDAEYKITFEGDDVSGYVYSSYSVSSKNNWELTQTRKVEINDEIHYDEEWTSELDSPGADSMSNSLSSGVDNVKEKLDNATVSYTI